MDSHTLIQELLFIISLNIQNIMDITGMIQIVGMKSQLQLIFVNQIECIPL